MSGLRFESEVCMEIMSAKPYVAIGHLQSQLSRVVVVSSAVSLCAAVKLYDHLCFIYFDIVNITHESNSLEAAFSGIIIILIFHCL